MSEALSYDVSPFSEILSHMSDATSVHQCPIGLSQVDSLDWFVQYK